MNLSKTLAYRMYNLDRYKYIDISISPKHSRVLLMNHHRATLRLAGDRKWYSIDKAKSFTQSDLTSLCLNSC